MSSDIKNCPFCGGKADLDQFSDNGDDWQVLCGDLQCRGGGPMDEGKSTKEEALEEWNKRA